MMNRSLPSSVFITACFCCSFLLDVKQPSILDALSKTKPSSSTAPKKVPSFDSSDSEGEAKPAAAKAKAVKRKQINSDDSDSSSGDLMSRLKGKATAGVKVSFHTDFIFLEVLMNHKSSYF